MGCTGSKAVPVSSPGTVPRGGSGGGAGSGGAGGRPEEPKRLPFAMSWELKEKLGQGQFATVYRAVEKRPRDPRNPRIVAVKVMEKAKLTAEDLAALTVEIKAMRLLSDHDNFVKLYESYDERDHYFLVLELISGGELFDRVVEKEKYSEREAREVIRQMTKAIAFAHSKGVAHRDLKPENVLLRDKADDTSIKIADLGFAKIISKESPLMTTPCGTPGYVAPEILSGRPYGLQADIWSLGVIFYILLCGYPPFADEDQKRLFEAIKAGRYNFDDPVWDAVTDGAKDLIRHILVINPDKRFKASDILRHPWMVADAEAIPDAPLAGTVEQLKRFNARRRLKKAMHGIRSTVRIKMLMAAKAAAALDRSGSGERGDASDDPRAIAPDAGAGVGGGAGAGAGAFAGAGAGAGAGVGGAGVGSRTPKADGAVDVRGAEVT